MPASLVLALVVWSLLVRLGGFPAYFLPSPGQVWIRLLQALADGSLLRHTGVTLGEVLAGLALGAGAASALGYTLAKSPALERLLSPYHRRQPGRAGGGHRPPADHLVRPGLLSKVFICALIVFFPVLVNTVVGMRIGARRAARPDALAAGHPLADPGATWRCRPPCRFSWAGCASAPPCR